MEQEERKLDIGGVVIYIDEHRCEHFALVVAIHGDPNGYDDKNRWPCINLVIVSPNGECQDQYGRQIQRHASVVHQKDNSAHGMCFRFIDEKLDPSMRQPTVS